MLRPPGPAVPAARMSPHVPVGTVTCPLLSAAALGAAQPYGLSLTTRNIPPASLRYDRLTLVARVAGPRSLAGDLLLGCVPARLSSVAFMAPGDVCHGPQCSLVGLGPAALEYRSCHWPGGSAGSPQCIRPWGCRLLRPVPLLPSVHVRVRCPAPRGACSPVCALCAVCVCCGSPPYKIFFALHLFCFLLPFFGFFLKKEKRGARAHCRHRHGQLVQQCNSVMFSGVRRRCFGGGRAAGVRLARLDVRVRVRVRLGLVSCLFASGAGW